MAPPQRGLHRAPKAPMPAHLVPMFARPSTLPRDDERWGFEVKWDGVRAIAHLEGGKVRLESRLLRDLTHAYPEVQGLAGVVGERCILDGEVVAFDAEGRPSFQRLQGRMGLATEERARLRMGPTPVTYVAFDLVYLGDRLLLPLPYAERRAALDALRLDGPHWVTPRYHAGHGPAMLEASRAQRLEGLVAKRLDSPYEPGKRTGAWLKVKNVLRQEFVIGGWTRGEGARAGHLGALLVGTYEGARLRYAGKVGTGYTEATLRRLREALRPLAVDVSPFDLGDPPRDAQFVQPRLVAEVAFTEWTRDGTLRAPSFKGLRTDKDPRDVVREEMG